MGSAFVQHSGYGRSADEVFNSIMADDQYENGHGGYSGTIGSARHGFVMVGVDQKRFTKTALGRWIDKAEEDTSKHGPLHCLELPKSYAKGMGRGVRKFVFAGWVPD